MYWFFNAVLFQTKKSNASCSRTETHLQCLNTSEKKNHTEEKMVSNQMSNVKYINPKCGYS